MTNRSVLLACGSPSGYPDQETLKIVTAGVLFARNMAARTEPDVDGDETRQLLGLRDGAHGAVRHGGTLDEAHTLCDHLRAVERRLRALVDGGSAVGKPFRVVEAFADEIAALCPPSSEPPMDTGADRCGRPWACLEDLFHFAVDAAARDYARLPGQGRPVRVEASLTLRGRGHAPDVLATTQFPAIDGPMRRSAIVVVELPRETFSEDQYFALLAKLHHEVFVHAVQAIDAPGRRRSYGPCCSLAEGLMDRAAHMALRTAIERDGLPGRAAQVRHRFLSRGEEQHVFRMSPIGPGAPLSDRLAAEARIAGRDLFEALAQVRGGGPDAVDWAIRLSMRLNLHPFDRDQRRALLTRIHGRLGGSRAERAEMMGTLFDVTEGGDASALLGAG